jgi:hypothetical protein
MTTLIRVPAVVGAAASAAARPTRAACSAAGVDFAELKNFACENGETPRVISVSSDAPFQTIRTQQRFVGRPRLRLLNVLLLAAISTGRALAAGSARRTDAPRGIQLIRDQNQLVRWTVELVRDVDSIRRDDDSSFPGLHQIFDEVGI